jgi:hypothetical protein
MTPEVAKKALILFAVEGASYDLRSDQGRYQGRKCCNVQSLQSKISKIGMFLKGSPLIIAPFKSCVGAEGQSQIEVVLRGRVTQYDSPGLRISF